MNKTIQKILIISLSILGSLVLAVPASLAQTDNLVVEFENAPLFKESNLLPGHAVTRWIKVTNNSPDVQKIITQAVNVSDPDKFSTQFDLVIKEGAKVLYSDTLANFFKGAEIVLSDLASGANTQYDYSITFKPSAGNDYQGKSLSFDIDIGFQGEGASDGGGGGALSSLGGGGGGYVQGLTILEDSIRVINITPTSVTIIWTTTQFSTSQVVFGKNGEKHTLNLNDNSGSPPKYGYEHTSFEIDVTNKVTGHSLTLTGLDPGSVYYFRVISRSPLTISMEHSFLTKALLEEPKKEQPIPPPGGEEGVPPGGAGGPIKPSGPTKPSEEGGRQLPEEEIGGAEEGTTQQEASNLRKLLAALIAMPFNLKLLLFLLILILIALFILFLFRRRKKKEKEGNIPSNTRLYEQ